MSLLLSKNDTVLTVIPEGRIDRALAERLQKAVDANLPGMTDVIFDLKKVSYISPDGIGMLVFTQKHMGPDGKVSLINVSDAIMEVMMITGFSEVLHVKNVIKYKEPGLVERAIKFAAEAHGDTARKGEGTPVILHPMEAASIVASMTVDSDVIAAAVLHDTVEDTDVTIEDIAKNFNPRIVELVSSETEDKRPYMSAADSWSIRKEESLKWLAASDDLGVKMLWLGDKLANIRSFYRLKLHLGDAMWSLFNQKDPLKHYWYYHTISEILKKDLSDHPAWIEYEQLIEQIFGDYANSKENADD